MIRELRTHVGATNRPCAGELAHARTIVLLLACFLAGLAVSALWFYQSPGHGPGDSAGNLGKPSVVLSEATRAALQRLEGPIELRFYSLLDPASVPASVKAFAGRVDQLLAAYQEEAKGKINLIRFAGASDSNANSAIADGVKPFNLDKGDACFLGIAVSRDIHKESLSELAPEWEQALEPDLTRAILRVANASTQARPMLAAAAKPDPSVIESVKRALPNLASVSVAEGTRVLREAALKEFTEAAQQMQAQVKAAQERLAQARNGGSDAEQQAAMKQLQQVQTEQSEKLKEIAAHSKAQIDALQQLKASAR